MCGVRRCDSMSTTCYVLLLARSIADAICTMIDRQYRSYVADDLGVYKVIIFRTNIIKESSYLLLLFDFIPTVITKKTTVILCPVVSYFIYKLVPCLCITHSSLASIIIRIVAHIEYIYKSLSQWITKSNQIKSYTRYIYYFWIIMQSI